MKVNNKVMKQQRVCDVNQLNMPHGNMPSHQNKLSGENSWQLINLFTEQHTPYISIENKKSMHVLNTSDRCIAIYLNCVHSQNKNEELFY